MKIGVISDTHIPDRAKEIPQKILEDFADADMIIHVGDLVDLSVLKKLKNVCANTLAVWGNMDPAHVRSQLPEKEVIKVGKFKIGIMHGYGAPANLISLLESVFKEDNVDVIIFGHSHNSVHEKREGILFFNPGSATDKVFAEYNSYGIIEINDEIEARIIKI
ncbi:MAG: hypothetical protein AMJ95_09840 [Omnitrophica WOR_2 bacterium SM23_72]|nr:MAG: hypothetical protein AMJ95_09840 [Omnitrophica WOR_2 bacterium SM23_72]